MFQCLKIVRLIFFENWKLKIGNFYMSTYEGYVSRVSTIVTPGP